MKDLLSGILILLMFAAAPVLASDFDYERHRKEFIEFIDWFHCNKKTGCMRPSVARKAKERLVEPTLRHCKHYKVDPLIMAYIFSRESSMRYFRGDLGEVGPGHFMPSKQHKRIMPKHIDLETLDGQIEAAVWRWSYATKQCPSLERALSNYASGSCYPRTENTKKLVKRSLRKIVKAMRRFRK